MKLQSLSAITVAVALDAGPAQAQGFPAKPVRLVVPHASGAASDAPARIVGQGSESFITTPEQFIKLARLDVTKQALEVCESRATVDSIAPAR